jgi:hypothetical protein
MAPKKRVITPARKAQNRAAQQAYRTLNYVHINRCLKFNLHRQATKRAQGSGDLAARSYQEIGPSIVRSVPKGELSFFRPYNISETIARDIQFQKSPKFESYNPRGSDGEHSADHSGYYLGGCSQ